MDPITILAAFAPALVEAGKAAISRWIAPDVFKPATIDDYVKMRTLDVQLFTAMNDAGGHEPTWQWVNAVKQLQRPVVAAAAIGTWVYAHASGVTFSPASLAAVDNFAAAVGFYLFGDRTLFYVRTAAR